MDFQIRLRTELAFNDIEYIKHWLDASTAGFAFEHDKPNNHHYHIYLFGLERKPDPMRKMLAKYLPDKTCYAVGTTAGRKKEPLNPLIAYQYGTEKQLKDPVWTKGFDAEKLERFRFGAEAFYKQMEERQERKKQVITEIMVVHEEKVKPDRVWQKLMNELIENPEMYDKNTIPQIKSKIAVGYLRQLKAVPRPSDLHRYAVSLYHIAKHGLHESERATIDDDALEAEYTR